MTRALHTWLGAERVRQLRPGLRVTRAHGKRGDDGGPAYYVPEWFYLLWRDLWVFHRGEGESLDAVRDRVCAYVCAHPAEAEALYALGGWRAVEAVVRRRR